MLERGTTQEMTMMRTGQIAPPRACWRRSPSFSPDDGPGRRAREREIARSSNTRASPPTAQAGGHPDIVTEFGVGTRFTELPMPLCACNDPQDIIVHTPPGVIANPHVAAICTAAEAALYNCSADSQVGLMTIKFLEQLRVPADLPDDPAQRPGRDVRLPRAARRSRPVHDRQRPHRQRLRPRHRDGRDPAPHPAGLLRADLLGGARRSRPRHAPLPAQRTVHVLLRQPAGPGLAGQTPRRLLRADRRRRKSLPRRRSRPRSRSSRCSRPRRPASVRSSQPRDDRLRQRARHRQRSVAGNDRLRPAELQPEPEREPDHDGDGLSLGPRGRAAGAPVPGPDDARRPPSCAPPPSSCPRGSRSTRTPPTARPSAPTPRRGCGTREPEHCPEFSKVGTVVLDSSALPGPIPGTIYLGEPKPGDTYRLLLTAIGFGTADQVPGLGPSRPADRPARGRLRRPAAGALPGVRHALLRLGARPARDADPMRDLPGHRDVHALVRRALEPEIDAVLHPRPGPRTASPARARTRPFAPSLEAGNADNTAGTHSPFSLRFTRPDGDQNLAGLDAERRRDSPRR